MTKYEKLKIDMNKALKSNDRIKRITLADILASVIDMSTAGKKRIAITDELVDKTLLKYKKTVQEMIDTCPNDSKYNEKRIEYEMKLKIVSEYAPLITDNIDEISAMINSWSIKNNIPLVSTNRSILMKNLMPWLKQNYCDMKIAQKVLKTMIV